MDDNAGFPPLEMWANFADYDNNDGLHRPHTQGPLKQDSRIRDLFYLWICLLHPRAMMGPP